MTMAGHEHRGVLVRWWRDGSLSRPGARRRFATVLVIVAVLVSLPAVIGALPVSAKDISPAALLAKIRASATVPYTGLASSSGQLAIPDLGVGTSVTDLLSGGNRLRAWWAGPEHYRVDRETTTAENDVYQDGQGLWTWDSDRRLAVFTVQKPQIPLPGPQDALPANLGRRLLEEASPRAVHATAARRIAGRVALGLVWRPGDVRSLIAQINVWADQSTGLPLAVQIKAVGDKSRSFSTSFLDVSFKAPDPARLTFDPSRDPTASVDTGELGLPGDQRTQAVLPATIGGLRQRSPENPTVATYGRGATIVAVTEIADSYSAQALESEIESPSHPPVTGKFGTGALIQTSLLTGLVFATQNRGYVLLGTVTRDQIEAMALDLVRHPASRRPGS